MFNQSKIKVTVDKSHLFTLGEKMYKESIEFIRELVNNAYDADAANVRVMIADDRITVADDGSGMNEKGLEQFFTVGSEEKKIRNTSSRYNRKKIGQFGIGKFSALTLAERFIIQSVKGKFAYSVTFDRDAWKNSDNWDLPIRKEHAGALDNEGSKVILENLKKKISVNEVEKYLRQSVPLRAKKFNVFLNNKKITAKTVTGKIYPIKINTMYGEIEGEIVIALNPRDVDEPGVECRVKKVLIKREFFGLDKKYHHGISRVCGSVNADFLPLISSRSDFITDSEEYLLFYKLLQAELEKILIDLKKQKDTKNLQKVTKELDQVMRQIRDALMLNPDFVPQGKAAARLKKEGKKDMAVGDVKITKNPAPETERKKEPEESDKSEHRSKKKKEEEKPKIEAKPFAMKRIKLKHLGITCGIVSLGEQGPEVASQGNAIYINQDHPLYQELYKKHETLMLHLLRLITQEIVLMKKLRVTAREAFEWQGKLLKDTLCK